MVVFMNLPSYPFGPSCPSSSSAFPDSCFDFYSDSDLDLYSDSVYASCDADPFPACDASWSRRRRIANRQNEIVSAVVCVWVSGNGNESENDGTPLVISNDVTPWVDRDETGVDQPLRIGIGCVLERPWCGGEQVAALVAREGKKQSGTGRQGRRGNDDSIFSRRRRLFSPLVSRLSLRVVVVVVPIDHLTHSDRRTVRVPAISTCVFSCTTHLTLVFSRPLPISPRSGSSPTPTVQHPRQLPLPHPHSLTPWTHAKFTSKSSEPVSRPRCQFDYRS